MSNEQTEPVAPVGLEQTLKRCKKEVIQAALKYQKTKDASLLPVVVLGVLERYMDPERQSVFQIENKNDLKLQSDLGMDSLVMVEVVMTLEEVLGTGIPDTELIGLVTIGDTLAYVDAKANNKPIPPQPTRLMVEMIPLLLSEERVKSVVKKSDESLIRDVILREKKAEAICEYSVLETSLEIAFGQLMAVWFSKMTEAPASLSTMVFTPVAAPKGFDSEKPVWLSLVQTDSEGHTLDAFCNQAAHPSVKAFTLKIS